MLSCFLVCHKKNCQDRTYLNPMSPKGIEKVNHDNVYKYPNHNGEVEGEKGDVVGEQPDGAGDRGDRVDPGWGSSSRLSHSDPSADIRDGHHKCREAQEHTDGQKGKDRFQPAVFFCCNHSRCLHGAPRVKGSRLEEMEEKNEEPDGGSDGDHEALEDKLESLLVLQLVELDRLKYEIFSSTFAS